MQADRDVATALLGMAPREFHSFVKSAIHNRELAKLVRSLNVQALDGMNPNAADARSALRRIGFTD